MNKKLPIALCFTHQLYIITELHFMLLYISDFRSKINALIYFILLLMGEILPSVQLICAPLTHATMVGVVLMKM